MVYLGGLKQVNGDIYQAFHIIADASKSCHTEVDLAKTGILIDTVLPKDWTKVFVDIVTKKVTYEFKAGKEVVLCTATAADITAGKTAVINGVLVTGTKTIAEVVK